jgi:hypothetical protein
MELSPSPIKRIKNKDHGDNGWCGMVKKSTRCDRLLAAHYRKGKENGQLRR